jgi:hypothetical protein
MLSRFMYSSGQQNYKLEWWALPGLCLGLCLSCARISTLTVTTSFSISFRLSPLTNLYTHIVIICVCRQISPYINEDLGGKADRLQELHGSVDFCVWAARNAYPCVSIKPDARKVGLSQRKLTRYSVMTSVSQHKASVSLTCHSVWPRTIAYDKRVTVYSSRMMSMSQRKPCVRGQCDRVRLA